MKMEKMTKEEFKETIKEFVNSIRPDIHVLTMDRDGHENIVFRAETFTLGTDFEKLYDTHAVCNVSIEEIFNMIEDVIKKADTQSTEDPSFCEAKAALLENTKAMLVREEPDDMFVYRKVLDMYLVYMLNDTDAVTKAFLEDTGMTEPELYHIIIKNMMRDMPAFAIAAEDAGLHIPLPNMPEVYLMGTKDLGKYGNTTMLYPEAISKLAKELNDDLLIMPTSNGMNAVVRASEGAYSVKTLANFLYGLIEVGLGEKNLTDNIYLYNRESDKLSII